MTYDDEILMAYADGELDEAKRAEIAAAIERDPELAQRVARHGALRAELAGAFAAVLDQPVPDRLREAARASRSGGASPRASTPRGNVVQFPTRGSRASATPWRAREWTAMAASLVLGGLIGWQFMARSAGDFGSEGGVVVARGELAQALDAQLASNQPADAAVRIGLTFKSKDGAYCRSFISRASSMAGLACRADGQWRMVTTSAVDASEGGMRQAATMPPPVLEAIEARTRGDALDAPGEAAAMAAGWQSPP